jgi:hypothetical protein
MGLFFHVTWGVCHEQAGADHTGGLLEVLRVLSQGMQSVHILGPNVQAVVENRVFSFVADVLQYEVIVAF